MRSFGPLSIGELLVGEASHLMYGSRVVRGDRATLLAAIGVEVEIKSTLRELVGAARPERDLVDLLLDNPRDWSMSVHGLFVEGSSNRCRK